MAKKTKKKVIPDVSPVIENTVVESSNVDTSVDVVETTDNIKTASVEINVPTPTPLSEDMNDGETANILADPEESRSYGANTEPEVVQETPVASTTVPHIVIPDTLEVLSNGNAPVDFILHTDGTFSCENQKSVKWVNIGTSEDYDVSFSDKHGTTAGAAFTTRLNCGMMRTVKVRPSKYNPVTRFTVNFYHKNTDYNLGSISVTVKFDPSAK